MAATIQYGHCTNKARCSLAVAGDPIFIPLDGKCPECGQPLHPGGAGMRRLKILPLLIVLGALAAGVYYGKKKFIDKPAGPATYQTTAPSKGNAEPGAPEEPGAVEAPAGPVEKPNFRIEDDANARARREVLARIEVMPNLTPAQKTKLTTSVDRARSMGCIFIVPFENGKKALGPRETDILVKGFQSAGIQRLMEDPTLVFVVLGYADKQTDAKWSLQASVDRAQSVENAMRDQCKVRNVSYSVGMGTSEMFGRRAVGKNRLVEIWAVYP